MNYEELVKALRHCTDNEPSNGDCWNCPYQGEKCHTLLSDAASAIEELENALADECSETDYLVNENARLTNENNDLRDAVKQAAAAIEALQKRLVNALTALHLANEKMGYYGIQPYTEADGEDMISDWVKTLVHEELKQQLPKRGEWIYEDLDNFRKYKVTCPHCGTWFVGNYDAYDEPSEFLYCPHCGNICNPASLDWENELKEREKEAMAKMEVQE